jgi:hypothetical protein
MDAIIARGGAGDRIVALAAPDAIVTGATGERVITLSAENNIIAGTATERIVARPAIDGIIASARLQTVCARAATKTSSLLPPWTVSSPGPAATDVPLINSLALVPLIR